METLYRQGEEDSTRITMTPDLCACDMTGDIDTHLKLADELLCNGKEAGRGQAMVHEDQ